MNLRKKKELAAKALKVGKHRICFNPENLAEIKEAITKQDIKTLHEEGIITIKDVHGRKRIVRRHSRRGPGKIKMKIRHRKQDYVKMTRKLRRHLKTLRTSNNIERELYYTLRKKIKMKAFKNINHFKESIETMKKADKVVDKSKTKTKPTNKLKEKK